MDKKILLALAGAGAVGVFIIFRSIGPAVEATGPLGGGGAPATKKGEGTAPGDIEYTETITETPIQSPAPIFNIAPPMDFGGFFDQINEDKEPSWLDIDKLDPKPETKKTVKAQTVQIQTKRQEYRNFGDIIKTNIKTSMEKGELTSMKDFMNIKKTSMQQAKVLTVRQRISELKADRTKKESVAVGPFGIKLGG